MPLLCPENVSEKRKSIIVRELVQGQDSVSQFKLLLQKPFGPDGPPAAEVPVAKILRSFTQSLSLLTSSEAGGGPAQDPEISGKNRSPAVTSCTDPRAGESGESGKISSPATKGRRGCYKRRRTADTWTTVSATTDDDHAWRKYGRKEILNSTFPRSYFRCTRKYDQGCKAVKQVQRMQENPPMYRTTYIGSHTCKYILKSPELITDSGHWESYILPQSKVPNDDQKVDGPSVVTSSLTPTIKQEYSTEETPVSDVTNNLGTGLWSDLKDFESSELSTSKMAANNADTLYSCTAGTSDFGVESVGFGTDHFRFDWGVHHLL